jgi:transposase
MAFREVRVFEVREVLRLWLAGETLRGIERLAGVDRKTIRRYIAAAVVAGVRVGGGDGQLTDELVGRVVEVVRPHRSDGHGAAWRVLGAHHDRIAGWVKADLTGVRVQELLEREGVVVPLRTVQRYVAEVCGRTRGQGPTVPVADGEPGVECQVDFGKMGLIPDPATGRMRVVHALIFTACYSRHVFVWLSHRQTTDAVIAGCEAAWRFFGGVFRVLIPDNLEAVVDAADALEPKLNQAFVEYAQARGFVIDPARVRHPKDKPRVERNVTFVRRSMFAGESFVDLADAQRHAAEWCQERESRERAARAVAIPQQVEGDEGERPPPRVAGPPSVKEVGDGAAEGPLVRSRREGIEWVTVITSNRDPRRAGRVLARLRRCGMSRWTSPSSGMGRTSPTKYSGRDRSIWSSRPLTRSRSISCGTCPSWPSSWMPWARSLGSSSMTCVGKARLTAYRPPMGRRAWRSRLPLCSQCWTRQGPSGPASWAYIRGHRISWSRRHTPSESGH